MKLRDPHSSAGKINILVLVTIPTGGDTGRHGGNDLGL